MRHRRWQVKIILSMDRSHLVATAAHHPSSLGAKKKDRKVRMDVGMDITIDPIRQNLCSVVCMC